MCAVVEMWVGSPAYVCVHREGERGGGGADWKKEGVRPSEQEKESNDGLGGIEWERARQTEKETKKEKGRKGEREEISPASHGAADELRPAAAARVHRRVGDIDQRHAHQPHRRIGAVDQQPPTEHLSRSRASYGLSRLVTAGQGWSTMVTAVYSWLRLVTNGLSIQTPWA